MMTTDKAAAPIIPRWKWMDQDGYFYMERWGSGDWVKYQDHLSSLAASHEEIKRLSARVDELLLKETESVEALARIGETK